LDRCGQIRYRKTLVSTSGPEKFEASWNPENSIPVFGTPFEERAEIGMIQGGNIS
jgi:hypothetical protein